MERLPEVQDVLKSFPWGRIEADGIFSVDLAKGRFNVLGGNGMGFWSQRGGPIPHQDLGDVHGPSNPMISKILRAFEHLDGHDLLYQKDHLSDEQGWMLPESYPRG